MVAEEGGFEDEIDFLGPVKVSPDVAGSIVDVCRYVDWSAVQAYQPVVSKICLSCLPVVSTFSI